MINRKYYYSKLSPKLRKVLDYIVTKIKEHVSTIKIINTDITSEQIIELFDVIDKDFPELFYLDIKRNPIEILSLGVVKIVMVTFAYCQTEIEQIQKQIDNMLLDVLTNELKSKPILEREMVLHDFLLQNVTYNYNSINHSDYSTVGPFLYGKAICEGYSKAYKFLCELADTNCLVVFGNLQNGRAFQMESHAWNIFYTGEGIYGHVDVTCNCNKIFETIKDYPYYNISDEKISKDHSWDYIQTPCCIGRENKTITLIRSANELDNYLQKKLIYGITKFNFEVTKDFESSKQLVDLIQKIIYKRQFLHVSSFNVSYTRENHMVQCEFKTY